jgi:hypothetical protein
MQNAVHESKQWFLIEKKAFYNAVKHERKRFSSCRMCYHRYDMLLRKQQIRFPLKRWYYSFFYERAHFRTFFCSSFTEMDDWIKLHVLIRFPQGGKHGILWNLVKSCGILWNPVESCRILWNLMESMESDGIHENSTESCGSQSKSPSMYTIAGNFIKIHK